MVESLYDYEESHTVVTQNKGQFIMSKVESNNGILGTSLFVIFDKWYQIRDFQAASALLRAFKMFETLIFAVLEIRQIPLFGGLLFRITTVSFDS